MLTGRLRFGGASADQHCRSHGYGLLSPPRRNRVEQERASTAGMHVMHLQAIDGYYERSDLSSSALAMQAPCQIRGNSLTACYGSFAALLPRSTRWPSSSGRSSDYARDSIDRALKAVEVLLPERSGGGSDRSLIRAEGAGRHPCRDGGQQQQPA